MAACLTHTHTHTQTQQTQKHVRNCTHIDTLFPWQIHTYIHTHSLSDTHTYTHIHRRTHTHTHTHTLGTRTHTSHTHVCHTHTRTHTHTRAHAHIHTHSLSDTHAHTHTLRQHFLALPTLDPPSHTCNFSHIQPSSGHQTQEPSFADTARHVMNTCFHQVAWAAVRPVENATQHILKQRGMCRG